MEFVGNLNENNFGEMVGVKPDYREFRKDQKRDSSEPFFSICSCNSKTTEIPTEHQWGSLPSGFKMSLTRDGREEDEWAYPLQEASIKLFFQSSNCFLPSPFVPGDIRVQLSLTSCSCTFPCGSSSMTIPCL